MRVTNAEVRTSTPRRCSCSSALRERSSGYAGRICGPPSSSKILVLLGSIERNSRARTRRAISARVPASSTPVGPDRKSTRLNSSHEWISYAVFCLKKKKNKYKEEQQKRYN